LEVLLNDTSFSLLAGLDIDSMALDICYQNCSPNQMDYQFLRELPVNLYLYSGSVEEADERLVDFECITMLEVIEHLHPNELDKFPYTVFGAYQPKLVIISTPNAEFNVNFPNLNYGTAEQIFRHFDHKFEWTRAEFMKW
jgi:2-polyprenyl-3-methyl-5-hydroxy-6-metoxy-1,4-benzoquinol methylase